MRKRDKIRELKSEIHSHHFGATATAILAGIGSAVGILGTVADQVFKPKPSPSGFHLNKQDTAKYNALIDSAAQPIKAPDELNFKPNYPSLEHPVGTLGQQMIMPTNSIQARLQKMQDTLTGGAKGINVQPTPPPQFKPSRFTLRY